MRKLMLILSCCVWATVGLMLPAYYQFLYYEIMAWSLLALSVDIVYGQAGLLSFGQSVYFAMAGYIFLHLCGVDRVGVVGAGVIALLVALALAALLGIFLVRLSGHYFVLATVIVSLILFLVASSLTKWTGGDDGVSLSHVSRFLVGGVPIPPSWLGGRTVVFVVTGVLTASIYYLSWEVRSSLFGLAVAGVKDSPIRMWALGFPLWRLKFLTYCFAASVSGLGGILVVGSMRYSSASFFHWLTSAEGVVWAVFGGTNTVWGAWIGTATLFYSKDKLSEHFAFYPILIGAMLIALVHFRSEGLLRMRVGGLARAGWWRYARFCGDGIPSVARSEVAVRGSAVVALHHARKVFDGTAAIDDCDLKLSSSEFEFHLSDGSRSVVAHGSRRFPAVALIGPNGAGKTTLLNVICGYVALDGGILEVDGRAASPPAPIPVIGRSFQQPQLFERLSVGENMLIGAMRSLPSAGYLRGVARVPELDRRVRALAARLELSSEMDQAVYELSYGRRKLVDIAVSLASQPNMLVLDEPTAGVSLREVALIGEVVLDLADTVPIILVEHNLEVVRRLGFDVVFMSEGKLIAHGNLEDVLARREVRQLFTGVRLLSHDVLGREPDA